jgi:hypothetical protein
MTHTNVAKQPDEERGKIGHWDRAELCELVQAFRELADGTARLITLGDEGDEATNESAEHLRRALIECTKALAGTVVAGAPEVASELARSFFFIHGSTGAPPLSEERAAQFEPLRVTMLSTETRKHESTGHVVDVSLLRVAYYDAETKGDAPSIVDALLVRRDRENDDRRVRHFPQEANAAHFDRAAECRAQWLGVSDGPFALQRPCSSS